MSEPRTDVFTIEPIPELNGALEPVLASVDTLRSAWEEALAVVGSDEFGEARRRSLRRHAIETGIIERLYDVDWGVTEALVAEGITAEVAEREGGVGDDTLSIIQSQLEALEFLADAARSGQELSLHFIRQLHALICRDQATYTGRDQFGRIVQVPLSLGVWKTQPNQVTRPDGSLLVYAAPEQVQPQMESLIENYRAAADRRHPVVRAAWLHHSFLRIHPFDDGNGRVARALTLLVLLRSRYAPLVVERTMRSDYIEALDRANDGDLRPLVQLFCRLEIVALRSELERPVEAVAGAGAVDVARAYTDRLRILRDADRADRADRIEQADTLASALHQRLVEYVTSVGNDVRDQFATIDDQAQATTTSARPPLPESRCWRVQLVRTAREVDFFTNLSNGSWWARLHLTVLGGTLRYIAAVQKVGHGETGVLAVTAVAESLPSRDTVTDDQRLPVPLLRSTPNDSVTLVYSDDPDKRWNEIKELVDRTLAAAVDRFAQQLG